MKPRGSPMGARGLEPQPPIRCVLGAARAMARGGVGEPDHCLPIVDTRSRNVGLITSASVLPFSRRSRSRSIALGSAARPAPPPSRARVDLDAWTEVAGGFEAIDDGSERGAAHRARAARIARVRYGALPRPRGPHPRA